MSDIAGELLQQIQPPHGHGPHSKVTIVGVGQVGMACAYSILQHGIAGEIALVDVVADKLEGEMMDLQHGLAFTRPCVIKASTEKLNLAPSNCHGWIVGEHGDSSVPVWSGVNVAGVTLSNLKPKIVKEENLENWESAIHKKVVSSAYDIIKLKGYTSWAIGLSVCKIVQGALHNSRNVFALSTNVNGFHGIQEDVYLSLPCVLGSDGITDVIKQNLNESEINQLQKSASQIHEVQQSLKL
ncbi:hypothetical protein FO519_003688 [Halicephalobus sp. NKZ332]|nr:hypothetical protein FO519_003688 [Halicephalobus sp. NKZ332]